MDIAEKHFGRMGNRLFQCAYIYAQMRDGKIPDIYLQDPSFFEKYSDDIREMFGEGIGYLTQVSIHVRRGDYVNNPFYVDLLKTDFYEKAIALFPDDNFLVFSDDPDFCREQEIFKEKRFQVMDNTEDKMENFRIQSSCKHHIIANSSWSFWTAWLSPSWEKKVIAPSVKNWYTDGIERTKCPKEWTRI